MYQNMGDRSVEKEFPEFYHVLMYGLTFVPTVLRTASCFVSISGYPEFFHMQVVQT